MDLDVHEALVRLAIASSSLLEEHVGMGTCFPEEHLERVPRECTLDEHGVAWYKEWLELRNALREACDLMERKI